jgi:hypothetical protein
MAAEEDSEECTSNCPSFFLSSVHHQHHATQTELKGLSENVSGFDNSATSQPTSAHMDATLAHTARF